MRIIETLKKFYTYRVSIWLFILGYYGLEIKYNQYKKKEREENPHEYKDRNAEDNTKGERCGKYHDNAGG